jgi:Uma2 family endonuclease
MARFGHPEAFRMSIVTQPISATPAPPPATPLRPLPGECFALDGIRWQTYEMILRDLGDHSRLRLTYDRGRLQIMSPLPVHERWAQQLALFVRVLAATSRLPFVCFGSMTIRREDLQRGLEPDSCFYLASWHRVRGKRELDFRTDPPPDLAIEIDVTRSSLDRMSVYAALGVPELWRYDEKALRCYHRNDQGIYDECPNSRAFPLVRVADLEPFLAQAFDLDDGTLAEQFQTWVRSRFPAAKDSTARGPE